MFFLDGLLYSGSLVLKEKVGIVGGLDVLLLIFFDLPLERGIMVFLGDDLLMLGPFLVP